MKILRPLGGVYEAPLYQTYNPISLGRKKLLFSPVSIRIAPMTQCLQPLPNLRINFSHSHIFRAGAKTYGLNEHKPFCQIHKFSNCTMVHPNKLELSHNS